MDQFLKHGLPAKKDNKSQNMPNLKEAIRYLSVRTQPSLNWRGTLALPSQQFRYWLINFLKKVMYKGFTPMKTEG
jgi:hypothetical protein